MCGGHVLSFLESLNRRYDAATLPKASTTSTNGCPVGTFLRFFKKLPASPRIALFGSPQTGVGRLRRDRRVGEGCWQRGRPRN